VSKVQHDITLLTCEKYVDPNTDSQYVKNLLLEDFLVEKSLQELGLKTTRVAWSDPDFNWSSTRFALFRTTWDYFERAEEFTSWLDLVSEKTQLINSFKLVKWSLDKHYLKDLKNKEINIVDTYFIEPGEKVNLRHLHEDIGLTKSVLKPAFSATARETYLLNSSNLDDYEVRFQKLIQHEAMLIQPFIESVLDRGEVSLIMIGDQYSHAVLKVAKPGDFRVQDDFGGTVHPYSPSSEEIELAKKTIKACPQPPLYARVDIVLDNNGNPAVSELELVEPEMWFREKPEAADELARKIKNYIDNRKAFDV